MQRLLRNRIHRALLAALYLVAGAAHAQLNVEVSASTAGAQLPVATAMFANEASLPQVVSAVIRDDLVRSGRVRNVDFGATPIAETQAPDYRGWNGRGAAAVVTGSVTTEADGRYTVRFKLYDVTKQLSLGGMAYSVAAPQLRLTAHRIADYVYEKLFGDRGVFATRLSFVTRAGNGYKLVIADSDGYNPITALTSPEPIISPAWSPDGKSVAYVSFESRKPVVYLHQLATGRRVVLANERGNNSAPSWSPDGRQLALALSRDGNTQVYLINANGTGLKRLSASDGIDTEPQFSPDGKMIYFTSDRGGAPQIYRMSVDGERAGGAQRVTFKGSFNVSPRISPDGRYLAFISRGGGGYKLHLQDLVTGEVTPLTDTGYDETPSFAANGKFLIYATRVNGRRVLAAVSTDGLTRQILEVSSGSVGEPAWGPFMQ